MLDPLECITLVNFGVGGCVVLLLLAKQMIYVWVKWATRKKYHTKNTHQKTLNNLNRFYYQEPLFTCRTDFLSFLENDVKLLAFCDNLWTRGHQCVCLCTHSTPHTPPWHTHPQSHTDTHTHTYTCFSLSRTFFKTFPIT